MDLRVECLMGDIGHLCTTLEDNFGVNERKG